MKTDLYKKVEKFVVDSFSESGKGAKHYIRTVYWVKELRPTANEALFIAAVAHDIERAFRSQAGFNSIKKDKKGFLNKEFIEKHQNKGAEIIEKFLEKQKADKKLIKRVKMLVSKHEIGGNADQNLLKDADSISYFENKIPVFLKMVSDLGAKKIKDKFDWMYNRITSRKAKRIARPHYLNAIKKIKK